MGQSRKQQLDGIFKRYPNKTPNQIAKDHGIPYSTVYAYHRKYHKSLTEIEAAHKPRKPKARTYSYDDMIMAVLSGVFVGVVLCLILGAIHGQG